MFNGHQSVRQSWRPYSSEFARDRDRNAKTRSKFPLENRTREKTIEFGTIQGIVNFFPTQKIIIVSIVQTQLNGIAILQEFSNYLIGNKLKHLLTKSEADEENLTKFEIIDLIRVANHFLVEKYGPKPDPKTRMTLSKTIHGLFPRLQPEVIVKKITDRNNHLRRKVAEEKTSNRVRKEQITSTVEKDENL